MAVSHSKITCPEQDWADAPQATALVGIPTPVNKPWARIHANVTPLDGWPWPGNHPTILHGLLHTHTVWIVDC